MQSDSFLDAILTLRALCAPVADQFGLKAIGGTCLGVVGWLLGGFDLPFGALTILFCADYLLGFSRAFYERRLSLAKMRKGIGKFLLYVIAVAIAHVLDLAISTSWLQSPARDLMIAYLAINEFLSAADHLAALGIRLPAWLMERLRHCRDSGDPRKAL